MFDRLFPTAPKKGSIYALIVSFFVIRLVLSTVFPVTIDEAYAVVVSRYPTLSYFDHPPLAFDFARLAATIFGSEALVVVRLPHVIMGSLSAWLLYRVTERSFGIEAAFHAVAFYSIAPFFLLSSGHFVVPDGPLNFFLLAAFWLVQPLLLGDKPKSLNLQWLAVGAALALALMSKYQAVLFGVAAFIFMLSGVSGRKLLQTKGPWLALIIAALGLIPVLVWNAHHDWISLAFQSGRAGSGLSLHISNFALMLLGQNAYLLPGTWAVAHYMIWRAFFHPKQTDEPLFATLAVVPIVIFDAIALVSEKNLPHWPMSGFLFAFPLIGLWLVDVKQRFARQIYWAFKLPALLLPAIALLFALQTHTAIFTRFFFDKAPLGDVDWQLVPWSALKEDFDKRGILHDPNTFIVPRIWTEAARAAYALGPEMPVATPLLDPRHFAFMPDMRLGTRKAGYAISKAALGESDNARAQLIATLRGYNVTGDSWTILQTRAGFPAFDIIVVPVEPL